MAERSSPAEERLRPGHLPALDGLRGIAVLLVMILHFSMITPQGPAEWWYRAITGGGWAGVDLFFVLSGFLITGILYDARGGAYYFRNFYMRRSLRIFPVYYAFLALQFVLLPAVEAATGGVPEEESGQIWVWTYLTNFLFTRVGWEGMPGHTTHLWSLAVEEQFYLLWPLIVFMADRRTLLRLCGALFLLGPLIRLLLLQQQPSGLAGYVLLPARVDALALGGLIAIMARSSEGFALLRRMRTPAVVSGAVLMVGGGAWTLLSGMNDGLFPPLAQHTQLVVFPAVALLSAGAVISAANAARGSRLNNALTTTWLMTLGRYSYAIYLFHIPLRNLLHSRVSNPEFVPRLFGSQIPAQLALLVICIAASTVIAAVSWHVFEKHFLELKQYFPYGSAKASAPMASVAQEASSAAL